MSEARPKRAKALRAFEIDFPETLSPGAYDRMLSRGWFRTGSFLARVSILCLNGTLRESVHIRIPLARYAPPKSRRRLLRRNRQRFRTEIGPARIDEARCALYEKMKPRFVGPITRDLETALFGPGPRWFETYECAVYQQEQLVAVSYFESGRSSVASLLGLHDPDFARFGLGIYTMLEEIEVARQFGNRFFYPGSIIPGLPGFDYKLGFGPVQFLGSDGRWRHRANAPRRSPRAEALMQRLQAVESALSETDHPAVLRLYPAYPLGHIDELGGAYLSEPAHVQVRTATPSAGCFTVEYDLHTDSYLLAFAEPDPEIDLYEECDPVTTPANTERRARRYQRRVSRSTSPLGIASALEADLTRAVP
jgi:arginine-tRNA-protein transferase